LLPERIFSKHKVVTMYGLGKEKTSYLEQILCMVYDILSIDFKNKKIFFLFPYAIFSRNCRYFFWTPEYPISINTPSPLLPMVPTTIFPSMPHGTSTKVIKVPILACSSDVYIGLWFYSLGL